MKPDCLVLLKSFGLLIICFFSLSATAQKKKPKDEFYTFDENWKPTSTEKAAFFIVVLPAESGFEWDYYPVRGPLVRVETHTTHDGTELSGPVYLYTPLGDLDSMGILDHGKKEGEFYKYDYASNKQRFARLVYTYHADSLLSVKDNTSETEARIRQDSLDKMNSAAFNAEKRDPDWIREQIKEHPSDTTLEVESSFPGGLRAWQKFLTKTLRYPEEAVNRRLSGRIDIAFSIDASGRTTDFHVAHSANYWLDQEALRVLKQSGNWIPAYQHCKLVKSYKLQPINMRLE